MYASWETFKHSEKNSIEALLRQAGSFSQAVKGGAMQEDAFEKEYQTVEDPANQGMTQQRGVEAEGADRYRVTLEVQQDLHGWFHAAVEPFDGPCQASADPGGQTLQVEQH